MRTFLISIQALLAATLLTIPSIAMSQVVVEGPESRFFDWNAPVITGTPAPTLTGYQLYKQAGDCSVVDPNAWEAREFNAIPTSNNTATGLAAVTTYCFTVRAVYVEGESGNSNLVTITTAGTAPPPLVCPVLACPAPSNFLAP